MWLWLHLSNKLLNIINVLGSSHSSYRAPMMQTRLACTLTVSVPVCGTQDSAGGHWSLQLCLTSYEELNARHPAIQSWYRSTAAKLSSENNKKSIFNSKQLRVCVTCLSETKSESKDYWGGPVTIMTMQCGQLISSHLKHCHWPHKIWPLTWYHRQVS